MIAVILTARPSYAKLKPILTALQQRKVEYGVIACASTLLERYGRVVDVVRKDGFPVIEEIYSVYEGETLHTSAMETGALCSHLSATLSRLRPKAVVVAADRHEVLGAAQAASYLHVPLAHLQGGERSSSIDNKVRDAITPLADYHFPATERAKFRVYSLTGSDRIWNFGCPSIDVAKQALTEPLVTAEELGGAGKPLNLERPFTVLMYHPVTDDPGASYTIHQILHGLAQVAPQVVAFWPGEDAHRAIIEKAYRLQSSWLHMVRNLPPHRFLKLLTQARMLVGNSSCGIRECAFLGVPVINVGRRQWGRERAENVIDIDGMPEEIVDAYRIHRCRYPSSSLYGQGDAGERIAEKLCHLLGS